MKEEFFRNPPPEYRIHPFWFWNGDMDNAEISRQISEMADKGVGGFFLCARQGMTLPYLSDAWFAKVKYTVEIAKEHGMHVWLYDEYPYPSGIAGGEVILQHPDAKHRMLVHKKYQISGPKQMVVDLPWGVVISAIATPITAGSGKRLWKQSVDIHTAIGNYQAEPVFQKSGLTNYSEKRFFTYKPVKRLDWAAPEGKWEIDVFLEQEIEDFKYYGTFVDPGHAEAMRTFIQLTHERYKKEVGEYFGDVIKGMFTDEIGYLGSYPWSSRLRDKFRNINGYDLEDSLQALVDNDYDGAGKIRYDYFQALHWLLIESYHKQVHDWCEENRLLYVAEVPSVRMSTQLYSDVIGSDSAHEKLGRSLEWAIDRYYRNFRSNPKVTSSLAVQLEKQRALVECFHSIGWSMTLQDAKWMIDRMAAMGVNFFNFHAFFYTLDGLAKHDAAPSQFFQNPYWNHFRHLADYVGRISYIMTQGTPLHPIALLDPTTSMWTHLGNPLHGFTYMGTDESEAQRLERLTTDWTQVGRELLLHQFGYDHLDAGLLNNAIVSNGTITLGGAKYSTLILPPMSNLEAVAWKTIKEFLAQGGTVIAVGLLPYERIEEQSPLEAEVMQVFGLSRSVKSDYWREGSDTQVAEASESALWYKGEQQAYFIPAAKPGSPAETTVLLDLLTKLQPQPVKLDHGTAIRSFLMECRAVEESYYIFLTNQEGSEWNIPLQIHLKQLRPALASNQNVHFCKMNLETGEFSPLQFEQDGDICSLQLHFAPYESCLVQVGCHQNGDNASEMATKGIEDVGTIEVNAQRSWEMTPNSMNVLRFDEFDLSFDGEEGHTHKVQVKTFIDQCADIHEHEHVPLKFKQFFGTPMKIGLEYPIRCTYKTSFQVLTCPSICDLFMDRSSVSGEYRIYLNGHQLDDHHFEPKMFNDHANIAGRVEKFLVQGENTLQIDVLVEHDWDGVVDALFLSGDFGVGFDEAQTPLLTTQIQEGPLQAGPYDGYPYYAGSMSFTTHLTVRPEQLIKHSRLNLVFTDWDPNFHDCAEVKVNGVSLGVRPWSPYHWQVDRQILNDGENVVTVEVTNTLVGTLEGKYFDYKEHRLRSVTDMSSS